MAASTSTPTSPLIDTSYRLPGNGTRTPYAALQYIAATRSSLPLGILTLPKPCRATGHDEGGRNWARFANLIGTCKTRGVEPYAYLRDLFIRLANGHLDKDIDGLMP